MNLSTHGPPETVLPEEPAELRHAIEQARMGAGDRLTALGAVAAGAPRSSAAWAAMGENASSDIEAYAYFRVGYHRGLDALRANGWRGSGYVHSSNRGFLRSLAGLARCAALIGEGDEAERCEIFLRQCDPAWPPPDLSA